MKADELIKKYTKTGSNEITQQSSDGEKHYFAWVTPFEAEVTADIVKKETVEAFARIVRANLTKIDEEVQEKFEDLYAELTGEKMYKGFSD